MRVVASFALMLLVLVASVDFLSWSEELETERVEVIAKRRSHRIRVFSSGWNFPPVQQGTTNQFEGALIDDRWFRGGGAEGLRVISIPADGSEIVLDNYKLLATDGQTTLFGMLLATTPLNTTLVLSSKQNLGRAATAEIKQEPMRVEKRREQAGKLLRGMGVRSNPEDHKHLSFVFVCVRRPQGFVPIAEKFSTTRGVSLAVNLNEDVSVYDQHEATTLIDNRRQLNLVTALGVRVVADQVAQGEHVAVELGRRYFKEVGYPGLRLGIPHGQSSKVSWDVPAACLRMIEPGTKDTPFDPAQLEGNGLISFSAKFAWRYVPEQDPLGIRLILRVNGRRMGDRVVLNEYAETDRWILWEELLAADLGPPKSVEIEVQRIGEGGPELTLHLADVRLNVGELYSF